MNNQEVMMKLAIMVNKIIIKINLSNKFIKINENYFYQFLKQN